MHDVEHGRPGLRDRRERKRGRASAIAVVVLVGLAAGACSPSEAQRPATNEQRGVAPGSTPTPTPVDVNALPDDFAPLEPGPYSIDPDGDPSTPLRVVYDVPAGGWSQWEGAVKFAENDGHAGVSITTMTNIVRHGCRDHSPADPPVGPSVDDLAAALADLAPFRVTSPPTDVNIYGYSGKHLELTVPDLPVDESGFTGCIDGNLQSWIGPLTDAFYGHSGPGYTEEFWILDVEGTRLVIVAHRSPGSPPQDLAELRAVLNSIRIQP
ncbi:MAG: hypothetical protein M3133_11350 [Actinomycetota bacterium]|nr:hypothetical protein [Actinomycetota bacterium]